MTIPLKLHTGASAAKSVVQRQGAGRIKHLGNKKNDFWRLTAPRLKNSSDLLTHHCTEAGPGLHVKKKNHRRSSGDEICSCEEGVGISHYISSISSECLDMCTCNSNLDLRRQGKRCQRNRCCSMLRLKKERVPVHPCSSFQSSLNVKVEKVELARGDVGKPLSQCLTELVSWWSAWLP